MQSHLWNDIRRLGALWALALGALAASRLPAAQPLDAALLDAAARVVSHSHQLGFRTIGVLKFRVQIGDRSPSDRAGTANSLLATRLEAALALANPNDPAGQVGLVRDASAVAATIPGAAHTSAEGRRRLFSRTYPLAWGGREVEVDGFITGEARVSDDRTTMELSLLAFGSDGAPPHAVAPPYAVTIDGELLAELGESYCLRGVRVEGLAERQPRPQPVPPDGDPPVTLTVLYDGRPVPVEVVQGETRIPEPRTGQTVALQLARSPSALGRLAAVVKVNGENTLYRERLPDLHCTKWILEPGAPPIRIHGYQKSDAAAEAFRVLAPRESEERAVDYGTDVGTISLAVFEERQQRPRPAYAGDEAEDLAAVRKGWFPTDAPSSADALKAQLRAGPASSGTRGILAQGDPTRQPIRRVTFRAAPEPIQALSIRYYGAESP